MRDYWYDFVTSLWRNIREANLFLLNIKSSKNLCSS